MRHDLFLVLDLAHYTPKKVMVRDTCAPVESRASLRNTSRSRLAAAMRALEPADLLYYEDAPVCLTHACACSMSYPRWWEQMAKARACFDRVRLYERTHNFTYRFVNKVRSDYNFEVDGGDAAAVAKAYEAAPPYSRTAHVQPWQRGGCYHLLDWFMLVPRDVAHIFFVERRDISCTWLRCLLTRYAGDLESQACMLDERVLVEWALAHGASFRALPGGRLDQHEAAASRQSGLVGPAHPWHRAGFALNRGRCSNRVANTSARRRRLLSAGMRAGGRRPTGDDLPLASSWRDAHNAKGTPLRNLVATPARLRALEMGACNLLEPGPAMTEHANRSAQLERAATATAAPAAAVKPAKAEGTGDGWRPRRPPPANDKERMDRQLRAARAAQQARRRSSVMGALG